MLTLLARPPYGAVNFAVISRVKAYNPGKLKIDRIQYSGYEILYPVPHILPWQLQSTKFWTIDGLRYKSYRIHEKEYKFIISGGATDGSFMFIVA